MKKIFLVFILFISFCTAEEDLIQSIENEEMSNVNDFTPQTTVLNETTSTTVFNKLDFPRRGIIQTSYTQKIPDELLPGHKSMDNRNYEFTTYPYESDEVIFNIEYIKLNEERLNCANVINAEIEGVFDAEIQDRLESASYYTKEDAEADGLMYINYLDVTYNFLELGEVYSVIYYFNSYSTGAAHPNTYSRTYTYNREGCQKVEFEQIFDSNSNYIEIINAEIVNQLCAPNIPTESTCEYVSLFESYNNSLKINGENIFNKGTTKFALSQYGLYIQFWEYDFYGASGSELILLPWIVLEDVLDKNGEYVDTFMKAYCVYDKYEFTEYEPMWEWVCES